MLVDIKGKGDKGWNVGHDLKVLEFTVAAEKFCKRKMNQSFVPSQLFSLAFDS